MERHVDDWIARELGPEPTPQELAGLAQQLEEIADSYGGDPVRYFRADIAWEKAFEAAEREGEASSKERLAAAYGWETPAAREAQGPPVDEVPTVDPMQALRKLDFNDVVPEYLRRDDAPGYEL